MINLIDTTYTIRRAEKTDLNIQYELSRFKYNLEQQQNYYRRNVFVVPSNHILVSLLNNLKSYVYEDTMSAALSKLENHVYEIASILKITTDRNEGKTHTGDFFGQDTPTAFIFNRFYSTGKLFTTKWSELKPLRVALVPSVKDVYIRPDMANHDDSSGVGIISFDIPALLAMYYQWRKENLALAEDKREPDTFFLSKYVLTNMLESQADSFILRCCKDPKEDLKLIKNGTVNLLANNISSFANNLRSFYESLPETSTVEQLLANLPAISSENQLETVFELSDNITNKNSWVYYKAIFTPLLTATTIAKENPQEGQLKANYKREQRAMRNLTTMRSSPDPLFKLSLENDVDLLENNIL